MHGEAPERAGSAGQGLMANAGERVLRRLSLLLILGLVSTILIVGLLLMASVQAVATIDEFSRQRELGQVQHAVAAMPGGINTITLDAMSRALDLKRARLTSSATVRSDEISVPVAPRSDRVVAWTPNLFGSMAFAMIAPMRLVVAFVFLCVASIVGWQVVCTGRLLDRRRADAARLALTDPLTGLANRLAYDSDLRARSIMADAGGPGFVLLSFDLDGFKRINDTLGHAAGDAVLRATGGHLQACADAGDLVARIGGDEFAVLRSGEGLDEYMADLRMRLAAPVAFEGQALRVTASIGVARSEDFAGSPGRLSHAADMALYRAKRAGSGNAELAVPTAFGRAA